MSGTFDKENSLYLSHSYNYGSTSLYVMNSKFDFSKYNGIGCDFELIKGPYIGFSIGFKISGRDYYASEVQFNSNDTIRAEVADIGKRIIKEVDFENNPGNSYFYFAVGNGSGTDIVKIYNLWVY